MEYALIVKNLGGELKNKELVRELKAIEKLELSSRANQWKEAEHFSNIVNDELFNDDFNSLTEFANCIGKSKQQMSQLVKAVAYAEECMIDKSMWSISKVYILSNITNVDDFMKWVSENHKELNIENKDDLRFYGDNFLKKLIKEYKEKDKSAQIEEKEIESEDVTPTTKVDEKHELVTVEFEGTTAHIPYEEYKALVMKYAVVEE